ncbi:LacI family DNA-binding transcriptional regulator [Pectobacterium carotovorum subsp. carotovorum]|nr:LacI family DNA-binding transcriptional regulator [Pectobacterium carotovorum subsp. carotovorum]
MKQKTITLNDVAEYAGVSYQTVSRVLNQAPHVSSRTRSKVEQAMSALNYTPNRVAQQLAGKTITTLGLVTTDLSLHAPSQIAAAIKSTASQLGINIVMSMLSSPDVNSCNNAVNDLLSQRVSGVIVNVPLSTDDVAHISQTCADTPVLFMDADPHTDILNVMFDPDHGARLAITHLVQLGHQHIALLTGPMTSISARLRYEGWLAELKKQQLVPTSVLHGDWSAASGYHQTLALLGQSLRVSAIVVANDQMALGVLRALHEYGLRVPEQMSVIGFDDTQDSAYYTPPLTTIRQDFRLLGKEGVTRLLATLRDPTQSTSLLLPTELVVRHSTAVHSSTHASLQELTKNLLDITRQLQRL